MLKEFRVENFKSIRKEQTFTMEACPKNEVSEYPEHVIEIKNERLLKVASIYGPNGGGKSNLFKALNIFAAITLNRPVFNDSIRNENYYPCLFLKNKNTKFTLFIVTKEYEIGYSLEVNLNNIIQSVNEMINRNVYLVDYQIENEEMDVRKLDQEEYITLFKRDKNGIVESDVFSEIDLIKNKMALNKNKTFLNYYYSSFVFTNKSGIKNAIFDFYYEVGNYTVLRGESVALRFTKNDSDYLSAFLDKTKESLNALDFRIDKLYFKEKDPGTYYLYIARKTKDGDYTEIPVQNESAGTIKAVNIVLGVLSNRKSHVFIGDDFDSFLHPKLIKVIIDLFTSKDNNNKQLIINSHDIVNMNNKVFRRDEIWFAYRNEEYSTTYTPLSSIVDYKGNMVRKDAVYGKQYLEGRYGADPFIDKGLRWNND